MINSIFFAPCAWYMTYHLGAWRFLKETGFLSNIKILGGASSGSLVSYFLSSGNDEQDILDEFYCHTQDYSGFKSWGKMSRLVGDGIESRLKGKTYNFENFVILSSFEKKWPYFAPRIFTPNKENFDEIKLTLMSSCYIPFIYENKPAWQNQFVLDGGLFVLKLNLPNTLTISPYEEMSENLISPEKNSEAYKFINANANLLNSLCPNKERLSKIENYGYLNAKKWFETYGGKL